MISVSPAVSPAPDAPRTHRAAVLPGPLDRYQPGSPDDGLSSVLLAFKAASRKKAPGDRTIANRAMEARGLRAQFSGEAMAEAEALVKREPVARPARDLRSLGWIGLDSRSTGNIEQLTHAERLPEDRIRLRVAVTNVADFIERDGALEEHARTNGMAIYTGSKVFPMFPWSLSEELTSLDPGEDHQAVVIDMVVDPEGKVEASDVYRAQVNNHRQLTYGQVDRGVDFKQADLQSEVARRLSQRRTEDEVIDPVDTPEDGAREMVAEFMLAANRAACDFLESKGYPVLEQVVSRPERWDRIRTLAGRGGTQLPDRPDARALRAFMLEQKGSEDYPDLSLSVLKLLGRARYVATRPGQRDPVDFRHSAEDATPTTAPFRRYADLITQRLLLAAVDGRPSPYRFDELSDIADLCTEREHRAAKVARQVEKSLQAKQLLPHVGKRYQGLITGASPKGTWVRVRELHAEGKIVRGAEGLEVGDKVRVTLSSVDVDRGFIDFSV